MKITDFTQETFDEGERIAATITWEDFHREPQKLYFGTSSEYADSLSCDPHPFLVAAVMAAMHFNEKRVQIKQKICPELKQGLITAMQWIRHWNYDKSKAIVNIEAELFADKASESNAERAGVLFSGGIDSLATLRANRINFPFGHPGSIKDGILIFGLEIYQNSSFIHAKKALTELAVDAKINLIPIYTNLRSIGPENHSEFWDIFWMKEFMGAALAANAHSISRRINRIYINSMHDIPNLIPNSTHPLIDPNFSSSNLKVYHDGIVMSRFEKTKLVAEWDLALKNLRVCNKTALYSDGVLNCGECEKCVRTMLSFLALGVLEKTYAFPTREIKTSIVEKAIHITERTFPFYLELIELLKEKNYNELVMILTTKVNEYYRLLKNENRKKKYIEPILKFDQKHFNGNIRKIKQKIYSSTALWKV